MVKVKNLSMATLIIQERQGHTSLGPQEEAELDYEDNCPANATKLAMGLIRIKRRSDDASRASRPKANDAATPPV